MRTSLIINTAAGDPRVAVARNPWRQSSYGDRAEFVRRIVSECQDFDEIIVAGVFEPASDGSYLYVEVPQQHLDRRDALYQREIGARHSTGDVLVFTHDDHLPSAPQHDEGFSAAFMLTSTTKAVPPADPEYDKHDIVDFTEGWDILVPKRIHGVTGEELNNGKAEGYMGGHTVIMKRAAWAQVPWTTVNPPRCWDRHMTRKWTESGLTIVWNDALTSIDLEAREGEL